MPADRSKFDDKPSPAEAPATTGDSGAEDGVDLLALEDEIEELEKQELDDAERRASELCRLVQRGEIEDNFLEANEIDPGHTIERHVGKDDAYLLARDVQFASTFTDLASAERAIAQVLRAHSKAIDEWLDGSPSKVARVTLELGWVAGRVRGPDGAISPAGVARVILMPTAYGYRFKTAMVL